MPNGTEASGASPQSHSSPSWCRAAPRFFCKEGNWASYSPGDKPGMVMERWYPVRGAQSSARLSGKVSRRGQEGLAPGVGQRSGDVGQERECSSPVRGAASSQGLVRNQPGFTIWGAKALPSPNAVTQCLPRAVSTSGLAEDRMIKLN